MPRKDIHKILVIRLSSIGDIVLTTPVVRCLKNRFPDAEIHYLTKSANIPILKANPYITRTWDFHDNFDELIPLLKQENFDYIADLHKNLRSFYVRFRLGSRSGSFRKLNMQKWLIVNTKINLLPDIHIVDRYFDAVKKLGVQNDGKGLDYFIPTAEVIDPQSLPGKFRDGFIAFVVGGKHRTKILPDEKVALICNRLIRPVILLGGKEDAERANMILELVTKPDVLNACGLYSVNQSASLVQQALGVVTNDTGLMHVAAAFRKPVVSVWGNTIPGFGMYPYLPKEFAKNSVIAEVNGLSCRPCSKLGFPECPKKHFKCMNNHDIEGIINELNK